MNSLIQAIRKKMNPLAVAGLVLFLLCVIIAIVSFLFLGMYAFLFFYPFIYIVIFSLIIFCIGLLSNLKGRIRRISIIFTVAFILYLSAPVFFEDPLYGKPVGIFLEDIVVSTNNESFCFFVPRTIRTSKVHCYI